jgi:hypothetical protein
MMNSFKWMIVPCCILVGVGAGSALADCGNGSLSGQYASRSQGSVIGVFDSSGVLHPLATPQIVTGVGQNTFDGNGSFVRSDVAVNSGVTLGSPTPLTDTGFRDEGGGTYKIDADCTGVMSLFVPGGMEIDFAIVVADSGRIVTGTVVKEHVAALPPAIVPAGTSCDAGTGCSVGVNLLIDFTQVSSRRR